MSGIGEVAKVGMPSKKPKDVLTWASTPMNPKAKNKVWKAALNPLPYSGPAPVQEGPKATTTAMTPEEEEAIKRRRAQSRPQTTVLTSGDGETLGG
jgi:hypothetical protein